MRCVRIQHAAPVVEAPRAAGCTRRQGKIAGKSATAQRAAEKCVPMLQVHKTMTCCVYLILIQAFILYNFPVTK